LRQNIAGERQIMTTERQIIANQLAIVPIKKASAKAEAPS